jgi:hypothetical protein
MVNFYRNLKNPEMSSFVRPSSDLESMHETVTVECVTLQDVLAEYGIPYYLKMDVEGADEIALASLDPELCPRYLSTELNFATQSLDRLGALGYRRFKLINQIFHTQDFEMRWITDQELVYRGIRKLGRIVPPIRSLMMSLPKSLRDRSEWTRPYRPDGWTPPTESWSGPFAEETHGPWLTLEEAKAKFEMVRRHWPGAWWDVHACRD